MLPNAALKSLHSNCLWSFPPTKRQPFMRLRSLVISSSASLRAGTAHLQNFVANSRVLVRRGTLGPTSYQHYESGGRSTPAQISLKYRGRMFDRRSGIQRIANGLPEHAESFML